MNPGPVTLSPRVREALLGEDLCHREAEFAQLTLSLRQQLQTLYAAAGYTAVLLTGSGSSAVEAMLATFAPRTAPTLVVCNGVYGERMAQMLERQGKPVLASKQPWGEAIDLARVTALLDQHPDTACLAVIHHETTTGRLNALDELAALCQARNVGLLIDAVSSFGGEAIDFQRWQPQAVAATANKCLHGVPGVALVLGRDELLAQRRGFSPALYLDLEQYVPAQKDGWSPFTQAVQGYMALQAALAELQEQGGWQARQARYQALTDRIRQTLAEWGVQPLLEAEHSSSMLTAYHLPATVSYSALHDHLKADGFTIYAGQGALASTIFRIATMGAIGNADIERFLASLHGFLHKGQL
ncbi:MAG: 2-aminoethylphosphonate aminotransferase [Pseudomonas sp.]